MHENEIRKDFTPSERVAIGRTIEAQIKAPPTVPELTGTTPIKNTERLAEAGLVPSVGSVGDSYDNALAETINELYKTEVIWRRAPWRSMEAVEYATLEWIDWFNNRRLLEPIGNMPPAEAEAAYYRELEVPAAIAA